MSFSNKKLGMFIRNGRLDKNLTQEQLAEKLDCNLSYLGNIERGKNTPSLRLFIGIIRILNLSADKFIYPVIATCFLVGLFKAREISVDVIAAPADGPSFGTETPTKFK